jgi:hypothetical protein
MFLLKPCAIVLFVYKFLVSCWFAIGMLRCRMLFAEVIFNAY